MTRPDPAVLDERTAQTLRNLLQFAAMAARLVDRGRAAYDTDEALRLAAEAILHKIGEAVFRLPNDLTTSKVDYGLLWDALANDLPRDAERIRGLLG